MKHSKAAKNQRFGLSVFQFSCEQSQIILDDYLELPDDNSADVSKDSAI